MNREDRRRMMKEDFKYRKEQQEEKRRKRGIRQLPGFHTATNQAFAQFKEIMEKRWEENDETLNDGDIEDDDDYEDND